MVPVSLSPTSATGKGRSEKGISDVTLTRPPLGSAYERYSVPPRAVRWWRGSAVAHSSLWVLVAPTTGASDTETRMPSSDS